MLGTVATTAAGVVAGSFLYHGIEKLMGHHSGASDANAATPTPVAENTVINNDYGANAETAAESSADLADAGGDFDTSSDAA